MLFIYLYQVRTHAQKYLHKFSENSIKSINVDDTLDRFTHFLAEFRLEENDDVLNMNIEPQNENNETEEDSYYIKLLHEVHNAQSHSLDIGTLQVHPY